MRAIKASFSLLIAIAGLIAGLRVEAQVVPAAHRGPDTLWAGAEISYYNPSFPYQSTQKIQGVAGFVDFNLYEHLGIEANARFLSFGGFEGQTERSLLAGPRYRLRYFGKTQPWVQTLVGQATINYPFKIGTANYFSIAPAAGVNYRLSSHWLIRASYEQQIWMNSPGYTNQAQHTIMPGGASLGVAYRVLR